MASLDVSDPAIQQGIQDVFNAKTETTWVLLTYAPRSSTKLRVLGSGSDGWDEMCDEVSDGKVCFGLCRFTINEVFRFAYLSWIGEGVQGMQAGAYNTHSNTMQRYFEGYHVQINGRNDADLWEDDIIARLTKAIGVNYDAGQRVQGAQSSGSGQPKKVVKTDAGVIDSEASAKYWEEQRAAEPASGYKKDLSYQKASGAGSLKSKFEQLAEEQRPDAPVAHSTPKPIQLDTSSGPSVIESEPTPSNISYDQNEGATYDQASYDEGATYEEGYAEEGYAEEGYAEEGYAEEGYAEEGYAEEGYAEEGYAEEGYAEEGYAEEGYAEEGYAEEGYAEEGYAEEGYYEEGYAEEGYAELYVTALYDYGGDNEGDLSFSAGDVIQVLDQSDPDGWWKGYLDGREGFFPCNFVEQNQ